MPDCKCLTSTYEFIVYKKHRKWWQDLLTTQYPEERKVITVHGDTIEELEEQSQLIVDSLYKKYNEEEFTIWSYIR